MTFMAGAAAAAYVGSRPPRPCSRPISYSVGAIDPRFKIDAERVAADARVATAVWTGAAGKPLFSFDPKAKLKINLIYDAREEHAAFGVALDAQQQEQLATRTAIYSMRSRYDDLTADYNRLVSYLNSRGGITLDEHREIDARRATMQALYDSLNRAIETFNGKNEALGASIERFNQEAGKTITAGRYVHDSVGERIEVYKFIGDDELTRFLAHEFGHAVGLDHNGDSSSIMYALDERGQLVPSNADRAALKRLCSGR
ncbi:MAG TPA: matrixin family metalloprotease [Gemmatimonadaceae bacterium]|jgi:hypothetical protein